MTPALAGSRGAGPRRAGPAAVLAVAMLLFAGVAASTTVRDVPPPTRVPPNGSPSPFPTALQTPEPSLEIPELVAPSVVMEDLDTGQLLFVKGARIPRPVASLTKLMTALVVLARAEPSEVVTVSARAAAQPGSSLGLEPGERISVRHLVYALLMQSANDAAVALAEHVGGSVEGFVAMMADRADALGLDDTSFQDPAGLDDRGRSTARDLAAIARAAYEEPLFARVAKTKFHDIPAPDGSTRHIQNRNILLWLYPGAIGTKTGFTTAAGHCLVAAADQIGMRLLVVALGAPGPDSEDVFNDAAALLNYGFAALGRVTFVRPGQVVGTIVVEGRSVPVGGSEELVLLIRRDLVPTTEYAMVPDDGLTLPVEEGQRVGRLVIRVAGERIGSMDLVAAESVAADGPAPSPTGSPPQPARPIDLTAGPRRLLVALIRALLAPFL